MAMVAGVRPYQVYVVSAASLTARKEIRPVPETCNGPNQPALITSTRKSARQINRETRTVQRGAGCVSTAVLRKDLLMAMDTMPSALDMSFRTALLLPGKTRTAEVAVTRAIDACEALSPGGILIEAVRSAVRRRTKSSDGPMKSTISLLNFGASLCFSRCC